MSKKILIVDDEKDIVELLNDLLTHDGYTVVTAEDGKSAIESAKFEIPDGIVLDIMMPNIDGYEVMNNLKDDPKTANIPVLIITARTPSIYDKISKGLGAFEHITKPFDSQKLLEIVKKMVA
jgi:CheY-like chemotaxis protein